MIMLVWCATSPRDHGVEQEWALLDEDGTSVDYFYSIRKWIPYRYIIFPNFKLKVSIVLIGVASTPMEIIE